MSDSSAIVNALIAKLGADPELLGYTPNGVYEDYAPNATAFVFVSQVIATDEAVYGQGRVIEDVLVQIEARVRGPFGISNAMSAAKAGQRIDELLEDGALTIPGYALMSMAREEFWRRDEPDEQGRYIEWKRRGGRYRIRAYRGTTG